MNILTKKLINIGAVLFSFAPLFVQADDTEIYLGSNIDRAKVVPNVVFIMDTSGSMAWNAAGQDCLQYASSWFGGYYCVQGIPSSDRRLTIVRDAAIDVINKIADDPDKDFNIALMSFNQSNNGGKVDMAMAPLREAKSNFISTINNFQANGGTPITETLEEAMRYLKGEEAFYGDTASISSSKSNGRYISPVDNQCQENHIVLFSDGEASVDTGANNRILNRFNNLNHPRKAAITSDASINQCDDNDDSDGRCAEELALLGQVTDLIPDDKIPGFQNVTFHTVGGFNQNTPLATLKNIARFGTPLEVVNGVEREQTKIDESGNVVPKNYYAADDSAGLKAQLGEIFNFIVKDDSTFTAPAVSVNAFNKLQHQQELYYSVFSPEKNANWKGNLKRYRLGSNGTILDVNNNPAIDPNTGFFKETSHSIWTLGDYDGKAVNKGGIASRLALPADMTSRSSNDGRIVTTYYGDKDLMSESNRVHPDNKDRINNSDLGLPSDTDEDDRVKILKWAAGIDVNNEDGEPEDPTNPGAEYKDPRPLMEDPLHSQPVIVNYYRDTDNKTTDNTVFLSTNSGYLHAFAPDKDQPKELFSFIPKELLKNIPEYYNAEPGKAYGLDGPISYFHYDINSNGSLLTKTGGIESTTINGAKVEEYIHLYTSMRRGGRNYYALDVSDRANPKFLWQIEGGKGKFDKLGQTWSKMIPAKVKWKGKDTHVLFFGGGYDFQTEDCLTDASGNLNCNVGPATRKSVNMGNAIYMVDAKTGKYLWSASNNNSDLNLSAMTSSIVSNLVVLDTNQDGYDDLLYSSDTGGRIWRIDLKHGASNMTATGGLIADMNKGGSNNIRFYNTIDLAYMYDQESGIAPRFQLSIGSGYRAHPLDKRGNNHFYVVNDYNITNKPTVGNETSFYKTIYESDLQNLATPSTSSSTKPKGYFMKLSGNGEKVLAPSTTAAGRIFFTTYRPDDGSFTANCAPNVGLAKLYKVDPDGTTTFVDLGQTGIPPQPILLYPPKDGSTEDDETGNGDTGDTGNNDEGSENGTDDGDGDGNDPCKGTSPIIAVGAEVVDSGITNCGQIKKTYWRLN